MDRLTERNKQDMAYYYPTCFNKCGGLGYSSKCDECDFAYKICEKLGRLEDLEEQGKLLKLPCEVGDTVWFIKSNFSYMQNPKVEKVRKIEIIKGMIIFRTENRCFEMKYIGKIVFLTKEAAENALKELAKEATK